MSIMNISEETLEQISGGYVFRPDQANQPQEWEIISDYDGSVIDRVHGSQEDARARAAQLNQSGSLINYHSLDALRRLMSDPYKGV